jgi:flagellar biosynthetic protein FliP
MKRSHAVVILIFALTLATTGLVSAQDISVNFGNGTGVTERVVQLVALITILSLAPAILVMVTSFTRIVVVLSLLRTAIGLQTAPPNAVVVSLALFLTAFVMGPTFQTAYDTAVKPVLAGEMQPQQAFEKGAEPFRAFMLKNVREKDLALFIDLSREPKPESRKQPRFAFSCRPS